MKKRARANLAVAAGAAAVFAVIALAIAAPPSPPAPKAYFSVGGHAFGLGEQQVYVIDRQAELVVRYRDAGGTLRSKTYGQGGQRSVAMTIEGISSAGGPVLALATLAPVPVGSASPESAQSPQPPQSPPPSPELDAAGAGDASGSISDLAPASIILSGFKSELPSGNKTWKSSGEIALPYGKLLVNVDNLVSTPNGDQDPNVLQVASTGKSEVHAMVGVNGFGKATLRGAGTATATSFIETLNKLLLGMSLQATSHGNATAKGRQGSYDLKVRLTIKLVHYVPGIPVMNGAPGFIVASGFLGGVASPDTGVISTANPNPIAVPAATNTQFLPSPLPALSPYYSPLPEASLPPVPIPLSSDQQAASPPPGPTPTPTPTHY